MTNMEKMRNRKAFACKERLLASLKTNKSLSDIPTGLKREAPLKTPVDRHMSQLYRVHHGNSLQSAFESQNLAQ